MKKVFFLAVILATMSVTAQKIEPITIGIGKVADSVSVRVITFQTTDKTCQLYYQLFDECKKPIDDGNLTVNEEEFALWGKDNLYIEDLALGKLGLTRKIK
jgi:hypothetical protein